MYPAKSQQQKTDWHSVAILVCGVTSYAVAQGASYPLTTLLLASRGASEFVASLGTTFFMLGLGFSVLFAPVFARGLSAKVVMVAGLLGMATVFVLFAFLESMSLWFGLRFVQGLCVNVIIVYAMAWLNVVASDDMRGRVSSCYGASSTAGFALGPLMVPLFGTEGGTAFLMCAGIVGVVAAMFALSMKSAKASPEMYRLSDLPKFARAEPYLIALVLAWGFAETQVFALAPLHMTLFGASAATGATFVAVISLGMFLCQPIVGFALDIWDRWLVAAGCLFLSGVMFGVVLFLPISGWMIWPIAAIGGGGLSCVFTCALSITGSRHSGPMLVAGTSAYTLLYAIGGVVGPPVSGLSSMILPGTIFLPVAITGLVGSMAVLLVRLNVNGGVKFGHCGGAKVGQFGASALERAALI